MIEYKLRELNTSSKYATGTELVSESLGKITVKGLIDKVDSRGRSLYFLVENSKGVQKELTHTTLGRGYKRITPKFLKEYTIGDIVYPLKENTSVKFATGNILKGNKGAQVEILGQIDIPQNETTSKNVFPWFLGKSEGKVFKVHKNSLNDKVATPRLHRKKSV